LVGVLEQSAFIAEILVLLAKVVGLQMCGGVGVAVVQWLALSTTHECVCGVAD
jgi:hypothetical protein